MGEIRCPYLSLWPSVRCRSRPRTRPVARCTLPHCGVYVFVYATAGPSPQDQTRGPEDRYLSFFLGNQSAVENFTTSPRRGKVRSEPPQSAPVSGRKSLPTAPSSLGLDDWSIPTPALPSYYTKLGQNSLPLPSSVFPLFSPSSIVPKRRPAPRPPRLGHTCN